MADLIWLESPSNPLLTVGDLDVICAAPRKRGAILGVDNTFATPLNQRPLALGADVAVQSVTKFIGGHSDLLGGVVTVRDANLLAALRQSRELTGATPGTLETFLAVRGARTLALRLERAQHNAMTLAERLARHPNVTLTRYPGLGEPPDSRGRATPTQGLRHDHLVRRAWRRAAADAVCAGLQLIQHATSLGAVESTIERRASIPGQEHLPPTLLRLSVGIEAVEDLWTDLDRALRNTSSEASAPMYVPLTSKSLVPISCMTVIAEHPLGILVTHGSNGLDANHLPFELETSEGSLGILHTHVARANPVWMDIASGDEVLVVFRGGRRVHLTELVPEQARASPSGADLELHGSARARTRDRA